MSMDSRDKSSRSRAGLLQSFRCAFEGIAGSVRQERNMKIHLTMSLLVIILGLVLSIDQTEWMFIALAIGGVLSAELMNSAVEKAVDLYTRDFHPLAKMAKDMAAGAVLVISVAALVIGLLIFIPKLFVLFS